MPQEQTGVSQVSSILEHLARFWLAKNLGNIISAGSFQESFKVFVRNNGTSFNPECLIETQHDSEAELIVENCGIHNLYVSEYDLGPHWKVESLLMGAYIVVTPKSGRDGLKGRMSWKLPMKLPSQMKGTNPSSCEDIIKVFVTYQPTSFDLLELPRLREHAKAKSVSGASREGRPVSEN